MKIANYLIGLLFIASGCAKQYIYTNKDDVEFNIYVLKISNNEFEITDYLEGNYMCVYYGKLKEIDKNKFVLIDNVRFDSIVYPVKYENTNDTNKFILKVKSGVSYDFIIIDDSIKLKPNERYQFHHSYFFKHKPKTIQLFDTITNAIFYNTVIAKSIIYTIPDSINQLEIIENFQSTLGSNSFIFNTSNKQLYLNNETIQMKRIYYLRKRFESRHQKKWLKDNPPH